MTSVIFREFCWGRLVKFILAVQCFFGESICPRHKYEKTERDPKKSNLYHWQKFIIIIYIVGWAGIPHLWEERGERKEERGKRMLMKTLSSLF